VDIAKGWRTSEFWIALGGIIASLLITFGLGDLAEQVRAIAASAAVIIPAAYALARSLLKKAAVTNGK
jgi:flagellar biosynthesis protein FlhB